MEKQCRFFDDPGSALLIALMALSLFSLLGFYATLNANTGLHISDNFESHLQAEYAAIAGLNHAGVLLRGLDFNDVLSGPDGRHSRDVSYIAQAKSFKFRNPLPLLTAQLLNVLDPAPDVAAIPDDGLINTGFYQGTDGIPLIPIAGIRQMAPNPYDLGLILTSRYFVKVTDNNGALSEVNGNPNDDPFVDGDGIVILRSMGIAKTISEKTGLVPRHNSVAVFEAWLKRFSTWDIGPALIVLGHSIHAAINGNYEINGGLSPGIGTIDTVDDDGISPSQMIRDASLGKGLIIGGILPNPSVQEISPQIRLNSDQLLLLNPSFIWNFIHNQAPKIADNFYEGAQNWLDGNSPYLGFYDNSKPVSAPGQDPKITVVNGDVKVTGGFSGGGLLIVTGNFSCSGPMDFNGLILVIGSGSVNLAGSGKGIEGELFVANLMKVGDGVAYGIPNISITAESRIISNRKVVKMAIGLIPASQISFREIAGSDP